MRRILFIPLIVAPALTALAGSPSAPSPPEPPVAKKQPHVVTLHGERRVDDYFWLREKEDPQVRKHLEAENSYTAARMKPTEKLQETLYREMLGRIKETDSDPPYRLGAYWYYTRTEEGKSYPIHCRKRGNVAAQVAQLDAKEEVLLDLNALAKGKDFFDLGSLQVSDDGNLLAYSTDTAGDEEYTLVVKDLRTGQLLPDRVANVREVRWAADNRTLFYVTEDDAKRPYRLYRHQLGGKEDTLVYEEKDPLYTLDLDRSRDREYLFATSSSMTTTEVRYVSSKAPAGEWRVVLPREPDHEYAVEHGAGRFLIRTNQGGRNFRLVAAPVATPQPEHWKEIVPHRPEVMLEDVAVFDGHIVVMERQGGLPRLRVIDANGRRDTPIPFKEPVYSVSPGPNHEFKTHLFRFQYESFLTPQSTLDYDVATGERTVVKRTEVRGGYDPSRYASEMIHATAPDGTKVPISLVFKKTTPRDGSSPLLLYGYGSYGYALRDDFDSGRLSLLDRGVIFAQAHIRGGGEMGKAWHDQGKMLSKKNTFTDFIAAADHLVAQKYTSRDRLAIQGGSAGGLLIGAVLNLRPDLCHAAVLEVPFVDVINTMLDDSLPLTAQEFLEWGNPKVEKEYRYIKTYCPYTNLAAKDYPAMLVLAGLNDSRVMYWEPATYVAKLRTLKTDRHPLLLRVNMTAGHGGASGRYDALKETAFIYAFLLRQWGIGES